MNIQLSQIILIAALIAFVFYIYRLRTVILDRIIYLACALVGIVLVIDPALSSRIANSLGIGRGADLLFYLFIVASLFYVVATRSRIRRLEKQITRLVQQNAIDHPVQGKYSEGDPAGLPKIVFGEIHTGNDRKDGEDENYDSGDRL